MDLLDPIPLSALQHWAYCPRQCGLIHLEQAFDDNVHTLRGNAVHARVDVPGSESGPGVRIERALPVWHDELGLIGKTDVVEFTKNGAAYPVEYKHGSRSKATGRTVPEGAVFYSESRRRRVVPITAPLRNAVIAAATEVRRMLTEAHLPPPLAAEVATRRCRGCSLKERCQPEIASSAALRTARARLFDPDFCE